MCLATILVPEGALDDELDTAENFCWLMGTAFSRETVWSPDGTDEVQNLYHSLLYAGNVNNGGHAGFVTNSDGRTLIFASALNGLKLIGAQPYDGILETMIAWADRHPDEVAQVMNDYRPTMLLRRLDDLFFTASNECTIRSFAHKWLCHSPRVRVISKEQFDKVIRMNEESKES